MLKKKKQKLRKVFMKRLCKYERNSCYAYLCYIMINKAGSYGPL